jgi:hypothetical protein
MSNTTESRKNLSLTRSEREEMIIHSYREAEKLSGFAYGYRGLIVANRRIQSARTQLVALGHAIGPRTGKLWIAVQKLDREIQAKTEKMLAKLEAL